MTGRVLGLAKETPDLRAVSQRTSTSAHTYAGRSLPWRVGTGGNFAVRRATIERAGGFNERLGSGTDGASAEDLDVLYRLLRDGSRIRYDPRAIVYHELQPAAHRRQKRMLYGLGLGAVAGLTLRRGDPYGAVILGAWVATRTRLLVGATLRRDREGAAERALDERLMLRGAWKGLRYGSAGRAGCRAIAANGLDGVLAARVGTRDADGAGGREQHRGSPDLDRRLVPADPAHPRFHRRRCVRAVVPGDGAVVLRLSPRSRDVGHADKVRERASCPRRARPCSRDRATTVRLQMVLGFVAFLTGLVVATVIAPSSRCHGLRDEVPIVIALTGATAGLSLAAGPLTAVLRGVQRYDLVNVLVVANVLMTAGGIIAILRAGGGLVGIVAVTIPVTAVTALLGIALVHRAAPSILGWRGGSIGPSSRGISCLLHPTLQHPPQLLELGCIARVLCEVGGLVGIEDEVV